MLLWAIIIIKQTITWDWGVKCWKIKCLDWRSCTDIKLIKWWQQTCWVLQNPHVVDTIAAGFNVAIPHQSILYGTQYFGKDQFLTQALNTLILSNFYISLDLFTIYFAHFSGCWASFVGSCHSIPECCIMFSESSWVWDRLFYLFA